MNSLERSLQGLFPDRVPIATSRGTTALYLVLAAVRQRYGRGEVIFPATVCPSIPLAAVYAGMTPKFCDVDLTTFGMTEDSLQRCLSDNTRAIVMVYIFGKAIDPMPIMSLARDAGACVVEDLAQVIGGKYDGKLLGTAGDFTILSFNDTKVLSGKAGAILVREESWVEEIGALSGELPPQPAEALDRELALGFRNLTHGFFDTLRFHAITRPVGCFPEQAPHFRDHFVHRVERSDDDWTREIAALASLTDEKDERYEKYLGFQQNLSEKVPYVRFDQDETCWRLPVLMKNHIDQLEVMSRLRSEGTLVSNHYFPASYLFGDDSTTNAREIGLLALNFWVDRKTDHEQIKRICDEVNGRFE